MDTKAQTGRDFCRRGYIGGILRFGFLSIFLFNTLLFAYVALPDNNIKSARALRWMARLKAAGGDFSGALKLAESACGLATIDSENNEEAGSCHIELAFLYKELGDYNLAMNHCTRGLEIMQAYYGTMHPHTAGAMRIMACIQLANGDYESAENHITSAVQIMENLFPNDQIMTAGYMVDMADILTVQGKFENACRLYQTALGLIEKYYGRENPYTLTVKCRFAAYYAAVKQYSKAEEILDEVLPMQQKIHGQDSYILLTGLKTKLICDTAMGNQQSVATVSEQIARITAARNTKTLYSSESGGQTNRSAG